MSESKKHVASRYYSACELTPYLSVLIDNDVTTTPPSTNTNSLSDLLDWKECNDNNEENIETIEQLDQNSSNIINSNSDTNDTEWIIENSDGRGMNNSNNKRDGIIVTTVKVVEVCNSVEDQNDDSSKLNTQQSDPKTTMESSDNSRSDKKKLQQKKNSQRINQNSGKKERRRSRNNIIDNSSTSRSHLKKVPSSRRAIQSRRSSQLIRNGPRIRRQMEYAPTSNPISTNDPTDMEADLPPLKGQVFPWIPGSTGPPKLIHASLIPLPQKNSSSSDVKHTKNSAVQTDKTSRLQLFNPFANLRLSNSTKGTQVNKGQQQSPIQEPGNRASQIFRRKLLEQSLAMSFSRPTTSNSASHAQQRPVIRKKTRKGSNARLEDREVRRERRRREREEKKTEAEISNKDDKNLDSKGEMKQDKERKKEAKKSVVMSKIIDSDKLEKIVGDELKRRETLISPQPPLRRRTNESIMPPDLNLIQRRESLILTQPPLRRKTNEGITTLKSGGDTTPVEQPPFPTHLSPQRKKSVVEENKLHIGQPLIYSANSVTTTPCEEFENITLDFSKPMINNDVVTKNEEESPINTSRATISSIPVPTASIYNRIGIGFLGLFNKREQSSSTSSSSLSLRPSSTSNFSSSLRPSSTSSIPQNSPTATSFSFLPRSPIKSTTSFSSFLPRYSRSSSPNPSNSSPSSSSRTSQTSNPTKTSKSSRAASPTPNISRSSTPNQDLSSVSTKPSSPWFMTTSTSNLLKSRPVTPTLQFSPPLSPKTSSLPTSPVSPKSPSRPSSPLKSPKTTSKLLRPGFTRRQTDSAITDPEKLRKMQKFEAIIAETEANNNNAPKNVSKIRAFKSAIITTTTAMSSPSVLPVPPVTIATASSSNTTLTNSINDDSINKKTSLQSEKTIRNSVNSGVIHFSPDEKENIGQKTLGEDGVIRLTITPAVCR